MWLEALENLTRPPELPGRILIKHRNRWTSKALFLTDLKHPSGTSRPLPQRGKNATEIQVCGRISLQQGKLTQWCLCSHPGHPGESLKRSQVKWWGDLWKASPEGRIWWIQIGWAQLTPAEQAMFWDCSLAQGSMWILRTLSVFPHVHNLLVYEPKRCR